MADAGQKAEAEQHIRWAVQGSSVEARNCNASIATAINLGRIADAMEYIVEQEKKLDAMEEDRASFNLADFEHGERES